MLRKLFLALVLSLVALPALAADWLIQQPGETVCSTIWKGPAPAPGTNCPWESLWCAFVPVNGDVYPGNYTINDRYQQVYLGGQ